MCSTVKRSDRNNVVNTEKLTKMPDIMAKMHLFLDNKVIILLSVGFSFKI